MLRPDALLRQFGALAFLAFGALPAWAQDAAMPAAGMARQSLRPYWHVFIAYAIAIALVLVWVVSISKRLKDVEDRLQE